MGKEQSRNEAFLAQRYHPETFRYSPVERPEKNDGLAAWIEYFDTNWKDQGLSFNWYSLQQKDKKIGFSIKSQLVHLNDVRSSEQVSNLRQKTRQDLLGFKLEYLSDHLIYPRKYTIKPDFIDPTKLRLEDRLYGKLPYNEDHSPDIEEIISDEERGGKVKKGLSEMKRFFLAGDTPSGSIAIMVSPLGETGLKTDDGKEITYPDSYFFIMRKDGDTVMNYSLKTDFGMAECHEAMVQLKGKRLSETATVEDFVTAVETVKTGEHAKIRGVEDVIGILQSVRPSAAYKTIGWADVYQDIRKGEQLYDFDTRTHDIISDFEAFCQPGYPTKLVYQKAIAATILRMSDVYFEQQTFEKRPIVLRPGTWQKLPLGGRRTFGDVFEEVSKKPGCAGGGEDNEKKTVTTVGGERLGIADWFSCSECGWKADGPIGDTPCGGCGFSKEDYVKKYGVVCD